jgi:hypothetical protein
MRARRLTYWIFATFSSSGLFGSGLSLPSVEQCQTLIASPNLTRSDLTQILKLDDQGYSRATSAHPNKVVDHLAAIDDYEALLDLAIETDPTYAFLRDPGRRHQRRFLASLYQYVGKRALLLPNGRFRPLSFVGPMIEITRTATSAPLVFWWGDADLPFPQVDRTHGALSFLLPRNFVITKEERVRYFFNRELVAHDLYRFMDTKGIRSEKKTLGDPFNVKEGPAAIQADFDHRLLALSDRGILRRVVVGPGGIGKTALIAELVMSTLRHFAPTLPSEESRKISLVVSSRYETVIRLSEEIDRRRMGLAAPPDFVHLAWEREPSRRVTKGIPTLKKLIELAETSARQGKSLVVTVNWDFLIQRIQEERPESLRLRALLQGLFIDQAEDVSDLKYFESALGLTENNPGVVLYGQSDYLTDPVVLGRLFDNELMGTNGEQMKLTLRSPARIAAESLQTEMERGGIAPLLGTRSKRVVRYLHPGHILHDLELPRGERILFGEAPPDMTFAEAGIEDAGAPPEANIRKTVFARLLQSIEPILLRGRGAVICPSRTFAEEFVKEVQNWAQEKGINRTYEALLSGDKEEIRFRTRALDPLSPDPIHFVFGMHMFDSTLAVPHWDSLVIIGSKLDAETILRRASRLTHTYPGKPQAQILLITEDPKKIPGVTALDKLVYQMDLKGARELKRWLSDERTRRYVPSGLEGDVESEEPEAESEEDAAPVLVRAPPQGDLEDDEEEEESSFEAAKLVPIFRRELPPVAPSIIPQLRKAVETLAAELEESHYAVVDRMLLHLPGKAAKAAFYERWYENHAARIHWVRQQFTFIFGREGWTHVWDPLLFKYLSSLQPRVGEPFEETSISQRMRSERAHLRANLRVFCPILDNVSLRFDLDRYAGDWRLDEPLEFTAPENLMERMQPLSLSYDRSNTGQLPGLPISHSEAFRRLEALIKVGAVNAEELSPPQTRVVFRRVLIKAVTLILEAEFYHGHLLNRLGTDPKNRGKYERSMEVSWRKFKNGLEILSGLFAGDPFLADLNSYAQAQRELSGAASVFTSLSQYLAKTYRELVFLFEPGNYQGTLLRTFNANRLAEIENKLGRFQIGLERALNDVKSGRPRGGDSKGNLGKFADYDKEVFFGYLWYQMDPIVTLSAISEIKKMRAWVLKLIQAETPIKLDEGFILKREPSLSLVFGGPRPSRPGNPRFQEPSNMFALASVQLRELRDNLDQALTLGDEALTALDREDPRLLYEDERMLVQLLSVERKLSGQVPLTEGDRNPWKLALPPGEEGQRKLAAEFGRRYLAWYYYPHHLELLSVVNDLRLSVGERTRRLDEWVLQYGRKIGEFILGLASLPTSIRPFDLAKFSQTLCRHGRTLAAVVQFAKGSLGERPTARGLYEKIRFDQVPPPNTLFLHYRDIFTALDDKGLAALHKVLIEYSSSVKLLMKEFGGKVPSVTEMHLEARVKMANLDRYLLGKNDVLPSPKDTGKFLQTLQRNAQSRISEIEAIQKARKLP